MRPSSADTSEPACVKRKMLSTKNSTSWPWSRKYSATVRPERPTRARAPGGSFIWPYTSAHFEPSVEPPCLVRVLVDARLDHLVIEVVAFARALADAGEHRIAAVRLGDVVDQLLNQHGLADAGAAEQADLAALGVRRQQIDDLDAGDQDLRFGRLLGEARRRLMDRAPLHAFHRAGFVDRLADHVDDAAERAGPDRHRDRLAGVGDFLAAHQAFGDVHGDGAHRRLAEMLGDFEHQAVAAVLGFERVQNRRQVAFELHVDDGADDLGDLSDCVLWGGHIVLVTWDYSASAPEMISISSLVIIAWRVRL